MNKYDVIVVGAGHAGLESAFCCAKLGLKVGLFVINKDFIGNTPCNPSIGGPAKGIVTREIDALGGMQAKAADANLLQIKMLNLAKGPGVWALRAQIDKIEYSKWFEKQIEINDNISLIQDEVVDFIIDNKKIIGIKTSASDYVSKAVILTTGTFLKSTTHIGDDIKKEGPDGQKNSLKLSDTLIKLGFKLMRLKTGTPPRILKSSIDFSKMQIEYGSDNQLSFSHYMPPRFNQKTQEPCFLIHTNQQIHDVILQNINKSAMYSGMITGTGPRYCPSIEDKVVRFSDKTKHQIFIEPESRHLNTMYLQGFSTSLDYKTQDKIVKMLPGLENCKIIKYAYAIEYDAIDPLQLKLTYETKIIENLFSAGQINGTSGYEEAAGQGLMAGINAAAKIIGFDPLILRRDESYIGVMTDDLMTKGTTEPYRLLTSRSEHRLYLRNDNAQDRLIEYGHKINLIGEDEYNKFLEIKAQKEKIIKLLSKTHANSIIKYKQTYKQPSYTLYNLTKRPEIDLNILLNDCFPELSFDKVAIEKANIEIKFDGYIKSQNKNIEKMAKIENIDLTSIGNYNAVPHLSLEAIEKLNKIKPINLGQASRVSGINMIDLSIIKYYISNKKGTKNDN